MSEKMPKLKRGDFVEMKQGLRTVFHELCSYTKRGKYRDYPIKRETAKDLYYQEGILIYRITDYLNQIVSIWRKDGEDKIVRIWHKKEKLL